MMRRAGVVPQFPSAARRFACFVIAAALTCSAAAAFEPRPVPGRLLLKLRDGVVVAPGAAKSARTTLPHLDALGARFAVTSFTAQFPGETTASKALAGTDLSSFYVLEFPPQVDLETIRAAYAADPAVEIAEFDMLMPLLKDVNDASQQWHIESTTGHDAHATGGWNHSEGDPSVLLAIGDSGVDWQHPDLGGSAPNFIDGNIWINTPEWNGAPGVDDDANGFVDDVRGWDFVSSLGGAWPGEDAVGTDNDPRDFNGHGTHVAGIAGAMTNNGVGVAGVGWRCRVMALRIGGSIDDNGTEQGVVLMSAAASAINYARAKGAAAFNCSWGSSNIAALASAVSAAVAQGMVICVAAGNDNSSAQSYLASRGDCFDVGATSNDDTRASFSNFGPWVDVMAPGMGINSTYFNHNAVGPAQHAYEALQGTSMATPVVVGLVGLVKAANPAMTGTQIKNMIKAGCDNIDALNPGMGGQLGSGRVNALRTFQDFHLTVPTDYVTFERALAASGDGDTLALRGGDVYTTGWYLWRSNRRIEGGWNTNFTLRDPANNPTLVQRSGTGPAVEVVAGINSSLIIDGVSFSGGVARTLSSPLTGVYGGGVLCIDASPVFRNCRFEQNAAGDAGTVGGGGGGFFSGSAAQLVDCVVTGNAAQLGGGLFVHNSTLQLQGCSLSNNAIFDGSGTTTGGGIQIEGGTLTVEGGTIANNTGADEGGGIYVHAGTLLGHALVIQNNGAALAGGNVRLASGGIVTLRGCELRGGTAPFGAGVASIAATTLTLKSCLLAANIAGFIGGGIYATGADATLENVSWNANRGTAGGGDAVYATGCPSPWVIRNSLVSNHTVAANPALFFTGAAPQLDYNTFWSNAGGNIGGGSLGSHDVVANPLYVDAVGNDLALGLHSPAIDAGDPAPAANDPDGSRNDRGAFGGPNALSRAPAPPGGLQATRIPNPVRNVLSWSASPAADAASFAVYRGAASSFVPSSSNYIGSVPANVLAFTDNAGGAGDWYRIAVVDLSGAASGFSAAVQPSPTDAPPAAPRRYALHANEPNPFNPTTVLRYDLPEATQVQLCVYDAAGRIVRHLVQGERPAGAYSAVWNGRDDAGLSVGSGVYVAHLQADRFTAARKIILVR